MGGEAPPITAIQNTQAPSEFLTTSVPKQKPELLLSFAKLKVPNEKYLGSFLYILIHVIPK